MAKVDTYLEELEKTLRSEVIKFTKMGHDEGTLACAGALNTVQELKNKIVNVENIRSAYLVL